ncbi:MAG: hypothetical protein Q8P71_00785 [bacterium]|nr:hypothetical protein [bacterium]
MKRNISQQGVSVFISMVVMTILLGIGFGMSAIFFDQVSSLRGLGDSVTAFYAAEAGIEQVLISDQQIINEEISCSDLAARLPCLIEALGGDQGLTKDLKNTASYELNMESAEKNKNSSCYDQGGRRAYCAKSTGTFEGSSRSIRITR